MKRAKVTTDHFEVASGASIRVPSKEMFAAAFNPAPTITNLRRSWDLTIDVERRDPAHAHLRDLMAQKRTLDNAIHAERLRLQR